MHGPVVVIGGGIAGLAAAHTLSKRGFPFLLLEAGSRWGGVIHSERSAGFLLEAGPDSMLAQKPEAIALCRELGLGERLVPTNPERRTVFVLHRGRLHPLPDGMFLAVPTRILPFLRSSLFSWPGKLRMGLDFVIPARKDAGDESIAAFLRRRFGNEAVARLGEPLLAGIHAGDPEQLSLRATFPRFAALEAQHGSLIRGLRAAVPASPGPPPAAFYTLKGGLQELVDALVEHLPAESLRLQANVRSLVHDASGFRLELATGEALVAGAVIVALPAARAAQVLAQARPEAATILGRIRSASTATVLLGYRREDVGHPLDGYGLLVPRTEGLRTTACSFFSTKFPGRAPEGHVLLRGFVGGVRDPDAVNLDDDALSGIVEREMAPVLGLRGETTLRRVFRWPGGTPQMEVGHAERLAALERELARAPGLYLTGAGVRGTGIPDTVADATRVASMVPL